MRKITSFLVLVTFVISCIMPPQGFAQSLTALGLMPEPGAMVSLTETYMPAHLKAMTIDVNDPFKFDFIIAQGDEQLSGSEKQAQYGKLIKYFLAALAVPDTDQWVNLSPYEQDRIIPDNFGLTEMGRDLLAQDYLLKQISSSLTNPDTDLGKKFWDGVYARAYNMFGSTDVPTDTFNKVWVMPDQALMYEKDNMVYVVSSHLKVMLDKDYLATRNNMGESESAQDTETAKISQEVMREVIIPAIEQEVNTGKSFAPVRQVYSGMLLATWYKRTLKESILGRVYADQSKVQGIDQDPAINQAIYNKYVEAFKKGVFNMIKEDTDRYTREVLPRKYFSGGFANAAEMNRVSASEAQVQEDLQNPSNKAEKVQGRFEKGFKNLGRMAGLGLAGLMMVFMMSLPNWTYAAASAPVTAMNTTTVALDNTSSVDLTFADVIDSGVAGVQFDGDPDDIVIPAASAGKVKVTDGGAQVAFGTKGTGSANIKMKIKGAESALSFGADAYILIPFKSSYKDAPRCNLIFKDGYSTDSKSRSVMDAQKYLQGDHLKIPLSLVMDLGNSKSGPTGEMGGRGMRVFLPLAVTVIFPYGGVERNDGFEKDKVSDEGPGTIDIGQPIFDFGDEALALADGGNQNKGNGPKKEVKEGGNGPDDNKVDVWKSMQKTSNAEFFGNQDYSLMKIIVDPKGEQNLTMYAGTGLKIDEGVKTKLQKAAGYEGFFLQMRLKEIGDVLGLRLKVGNQEILISVDDIKANTIDGVFKMDLATILKLSGKTKFSFHELTAITFSSVKKAQIIMGEATITDKGEIQEAALESLKKIFVSPLVKAASGAYTGRVSYQYAQGGLRLQIVAKEYSKPQMQQFLAVRIGAEIGQEVLVTVGERVWENGGNGDYEVTFMPLDDANLFGPYVPYVGKAPFSSKMGRSLDKIKSVLAKRVEALRYIVTGGVAYPIVEESQNTEDARFLVRRMLWRVALGMTGFAFSSSFFAPKTDAANPFVEYSNVADGKDGKKMDTVLVFKGDVKNIILKENDTFSINPTTNDSGVTATHVKIKGFVRGLDPRLMFEYLDAQGNVVGEGESRYVDGLHLPAFFYQKPNSVSVGGREIFKGKKVWYNFNDKARLVTVTSIEVLEQNGQTSIVVKLKDPQGNLGRGDRIYYYEGFSPTDDTSDLLKEPAGPDFGEEMYTEEKRNEFDKSEILWSPQLSFNQQLTIIRDKMKNNFNTENIRILSVGSSSEGAVIMALLPMGMDVKTDNQVLEMFKESIPELEVMDVSRDARFFYVSIPYVPKKGTGARVLGKGTGGIDFAQSNLDMQIKRDGNGIMLPVSQQDLENIRIDGLVPVILDIRPVTGVSVFK